MSPRKFNLNLLRIAGYHDDQQEFTRLLISSRINRAVATEAYMKGQEQFAAGVKCTCSKCAQPNEKTN